MLKRILVTGANAGLGKECARHLAQKVGVETIYLGCRNLQKAALAKQELERLTGKNIFEILHIDIADLQSVSSAVAGLNMPIDALVMNAGGTGGKKFYERTAAGVSQIVAVNLLGHVALTNELLAAKKLTQVAVYAGSEAARGVAEMGMAQPKLATSSEDEFATICDGSFFPETKDATVAYGSIKYMAALWMSSIARQHPKIRFVTMSPGGTTGTQGFNTLAPLKQYLMKAMMQLMLIIGKVHRVEIGAKRFVDALFDSSYKSGGFYASAKGLTGQVIEQGRLFSDLDNIQYQDNAKAAIERFIVS